MLKKLFGTKNTRELKRMGKIVARITQLKPDFQALTDAALQAKTAEFRQRLEDGQALHDILR